MKFGVHVSIAGGLPKAVKRAVALGCDCFQIFVGNPRSWQDRTVGEDEILAFREARTASGLGPVIVHMTYLPNPATADRTIRRKSLRQMRNQYEVAHAIGADLFVIHPGSAGDSPVKNAVKRVTDALDRTLDGLADGPCILLENTAAAGSLLGGTPEQLAEIALAAEKADRVDVCLDTAHAYAAGFHIGTADSTATLCKRFSTAFGRNPIRLVHLNDLRSPFASRRDRHEHIGLGSIGRDGLGAVVGERGMKSVPFILETPVDREGDDLRNLERARTLVRA
jgi:deoxyribonuclease-4